MKIQYNELSKEQRNKLIALAGADNFWKYRFDSLSKEEQLKFGTIAFGKNVKSVQLDFVYSINNRRDIIFIIADEPTLMQ